MWENVTLRSRSFLETSDPIFHEKIALHPDKLCTWIDMMTSLAKILFEDRPPEPNVSYVNPRAND